MKIYTKQGDSGTTSLVGGERVKKYDLRVEAYGTVDELSAHIALLADMLSERDADDIQADLKHVLAMLMTVEALLAVGKGGEKKLADLSDSEIDRLEKRIDEISTLLKPVERFTLLGGNAVVSQTHVCRTVCRRAERRAFEAADNYEVSANAIKYLNRLSDYLYVVSRRMAEILEVKEILWEP